MAQVNLKDKVALFIDNGLFVDSAVQLAKSYKKVLYWTHWQSSFVKSNDTLVGYGLKNVERVFRIFPAIKEADVIVFPDIYDGDWQVELRAAGKAVWGSGMGENLELYRKESKELFKKLGLPVGKYKVVIGMDALREYLKERDNVWVKISIYRGDFETFHSPNYSLVEPKLDELEYKLGAKKCLTEFIIEDALDDKVEIGYDGYTINGQFPTKSLSGIEVKDLGYVGIFKNYKDLPLAITEFNTKLAPTLKEYNYMGFYSTEMRVGRDKVSFMNDLCARAGSPPSEVYQNFYTNLAEIIWEGAHGNCIDPIPAAKYAVEILIHSSWADKNWQAIEFPKEVANKVKFRNHCVINSKHYVVPSSVGLPEIGAVLGMGNTLEAAIKEATSVAEQVKGYYINIPSESLDKAKQEIKKLESFGINLFNETLKLKK